jgi:hypothetical protein
MVYSGFRYARLAAERGIPIAALNIGKTRADSLLSLKLEASCGETLSACAALLARSRTEEEPSRISPA